MSRMTKEELDEVRESTTALKQAGRPQYAIREKLLAEIDALEEALAGERARAEAFGQRIAAMETLVEDTKRKLEERIGDGAPALSGDVLGQVQERQRQAARLLDGVIERLDDIASNVDETMSRLLEVSTKYGISEILMNEVPDITGRITMDEFEDIAEALAGRIKKIIEANGAASEPTEETSPPSGRP